MSRKLGHPLQTDNMLVLPLHPNLKEKL